MSKTFAVIENNKVTNLIFSEVNEEITSNPDKYIDITDGWDYENGIDGGDFFVPVVELELPPIVEA
jgi:type I restriction-modification system DNA methylase subunit